MDRRTFLRTTISAAAANTLLLDKTFSAAKTKNYRKLNTTKGKNPPNIIMIMAETMSANELGCYGNTEHETPNIDKLAENGIQFKTCWATAICIPTRAEIITGRYGFRTGWFHNMLRIPNGEPYRGQKLTRDNKIITEPLKKKGYATAFAAKWQLPGDPEEYDFDESNWWPGYFRDPKIKEKYLNEYDGFINPLGFTPDFWKPYLIHNQELVKTTEKDFAPDIWTDFINDFVKRNTEKNKPFFAYYAANLCHVGWDIHQNKHTFVTVPEVDENGNKTGGLTKGSYKSNIEYLDYLVGRIIKNLEELGIRDNTIIIFTSDHASDDYGKWFMVEERGQRVPMIVNCPGKIPANEKRNELIDFSDIFPTVCELAGASIPEDYVIDGHSFAPLLLGKTYKEREWIFSYVAEQRALRDKRWLLDGNNHFYDCGNKRNEKGYKDVTNSDNPEVIKARKKFQSILKQLPGPDLNNKYVQKCLKKIEKKKKKKPLYKKFKKAGKF